MRRWWMAVGCAAFVACGAGGTSFVRTGTVAMEPAPTMLKEVAANQKSDVRVWSAGIRPDGLSNPQLRRKSPAVETIVGDWDPGAVHVGFWIHNDRTRPIALDLDTTRLVVDVPGLRKFLVSPVKKGLEAIGGGETRDIAVYFDLPQGVTADRVHGYQVQWVWLEADRRSVMRTSFAHVTSEPVDTADYVPGFYGGPTYYAFVSAPPRSAPAAPKK